MTKKLDIVPDLANLNFMKLDDDGYARKKAVLNREVRHISLSGQETIVELVEGMKRMSIQARNIGKCAEVLDGMLTDPRRPLVFLGLAGPLIAAGLRSVIRDLVVNKVVDVIVSTGAIIYQDIYTARGNRHYMGTPDADDATLHELRIDRIYDTYTDEEQFLKTDSWIGGIAGELPPGVYSSRSFLNEVARRLDDEDSILYQCHKHTVPVFCPALNDSSIGIGLTDHKFICRQEGRESVVIDSIRDNYEIVQIVGRAEATAAIYVAGGVPKNYINDSIVMGYIFGQERGHDYAIQMTTAVTADGGLSSSTLDEAKSWGKIDERASSAMAWVEPSVALPLLSGYVFGKGLAEKRNRLRFSWDGAELVDLDEQDAE